ncbi:MAG: PA2779 family protein [Acidobacteria bacterium]|nr:PA2779 family protein [Acidobacteriota bacterium]
MKLVRRTIAVCLAVLFMAPAANAQSNVIGKSALDKAVQERVAQDQSDRAAIQSLLRRAEVREVAGKAGLSLDKAVAAVSTLQGDDLRQLAEQARQADNQLAGGASTVVISTTTIIIVLLLVILIIAIAN